MAQFGVGADEAFEMLRQRSNADNVKIRDLARRVVDTGQLGGA
jgi:AmiR/NasT family two-component response regulator